jgi:ATP-dependent DNA helicase DinG
LIRDVTDRGVLVICDNRLVMRPYGATFLASLPPAPRTRDKTRGAFPGKPNGGVICPGVC